MRFFLIFFLFVLCFHFVSGQDKPIRRVIQFTGVIFGGDSNTVSGVHVYIPKSGRGTTANPYGFFSLPVQEGDSVVLSAVGYKRAFYIIPEHKSESSMRLLVTLEEDIQFLEEIEVLPYPTEAMFKDAIIAMDLSEGQEYLNMYEWMSGEIMRKGYYDLPATPTANSQYFIQQQFRAYINRYSPPQIPLLNPFAWGQFIRSLQKN